MCRGSMSGTIALVQRGGRADDRPAGDGGADALTPSERRVVELAAAAGTNREIAQGLFVTEKTVETHLERAFRKLVLAHAAG
jgi:DNA-binding CsgD family transcriptional regulator